eukprot:CAMPEP_0176457426 /NCGR_PEP_ID=MMETSP0127-20121128/31927_1 /TAXON_ID=938130 /ORGANISM="Platyophrya macrostoma, Strain WH" /LENGTH=273 /DNA_ID=CAMNT_0017847675 /DNA_START=25 /DNA_END=846 /DNA_ORIENTATION=+
MISGGKVQQLLEKSEHLLKENRYYEFEQKIKTFSSRFLSSDKVPEAVELLFGGAVKLFEVKDDGAAYGLINMAITTIKEKSLDFDKLYKKNFLNIFNAIQYSKEKLELGLKVMAMFYKEQDREISMLCAEEALKKEEYHIVQKFLLKCEDSNKFAVSMLQQWMKLGEPQERDLFVVRYILMKLAVHRPADAKFIYDAFRKEMKTPLMNFAGLLIKAAELHSTKAFEVLLKGYEVSYDRDPSFAKILRKIGSVYFGYASENETMFSGFFKMLSN